MENHKKPAMENVEKLDPTVSLLSDEEKKMIKGTGSGDNGLPPRYTIKTHKPTQR